LFHAAFAVKNNSPRAFDPSSAPQTRLITQSPHLKLNTKSSTHSWYAVWNVYEVHQYVLSWATAVNVTSSQAAILGAVDPSVPNTSTAVMVTLINKYGLNPNADAALVKMLELPTKIPQPTYGNTRVRGESSTPSPAIWQALLVARLQDVLDVVMGNFTDFLGAVDNGTFSTRGLASASDLEAELKGASANVTASVSTHKSVRHHTPPFHHTHTPSASVSPYTSVTAYVTASLDTTYTDSSHIPASTVATVSARRPEGESTGPS